MMQCSLRIALIATYPLLALSVLLFCGLVFGGAFIVAFTVENRTNETIFVTPVGAVGSAGSRHPLPVHTVLHPWIPPLPASQCGGFELPPGESVEIRYDMDDINFSEIVVHDHSGERGQLVVNPEPTHNRYRAPAQRHFVIDDLEALMTTPGPVRDAAHAARTSDKWPLRFAFVVVAPWVAWSILLLLDRIARRAPPPPPLLRSRMPGSV